MKRSDQKEQATTPSSSLSSSSPSRSQRRRRKASRKSIEAAAAAAAQTKKQPPKKELAPSSKSSKKKTVSTAAAPASSNSPSHRPPRQRQEPPFDLYQNPAHASFAEGFASIISILQQCKRIVVLSGAGISVSCGIPDFRTVGSGLYSTLDYESYGLTSAEDLFDYDVFQENPVPFFKFARHLYYPTLVNQSNNNINNAASAPVDDNAGGSNSSDGSSATAAAAVEPSQPPLPSQPQRARPSDSHKLLALLEQKKKLLRVYSQNIDGLEQQAGVSAKKVVYAHGSLQWATCCKCKRKVKSVQENVYFQASILAGNVAYCQAPIAVTSSSSKNKNNHPEKAGASWRESSSTTRNRSNKRPRAASATTEDNNNSSNMNAAICGGVLKPGVTFFGETLQDTVGKCLEADRDKVDALIVIGTSLSVAPISKVIHYLPPNIPRILINRTIVHPEPKPQHQTQQADNDSTSDDSEEVEQVDFRDDYVFDAYLLGYCDDVTRALAKHLFAPPSETPPEIEVGRLVANLVENIQNTSKLKENESHNNDGEDGAEDDAEDEEDSLYNAQDWASITVPKNRVFLFPGATPNNELALSSASQHCGEDSTTVESPPRFCEIAHCDACAKRIVVGMIQKCVICFDYDLCSDCYPTISKAHHDGKHVFCAEPAAPL
jgi:NAD-dependent SIR2 family protein deacetylase